MHEYTAETEELARLVVDYALERIREEPPLDGPRPLAELEVTAGATISAEGMGPDAVRLWDEVLSRACLSQDHPRALSFVPSAPSNAAVLFDLVVGASAIYGGSWLEGAGAIYAENQALRWVADLAGLPESAGGCFVSGGTAGNLSALVAARDGAAHERARPDRWRVLVSSESHSSIAASARVMDVDLVEATVDERGRMTGATAADALDGAEGVFAIVGTAGTTNAGMIDDLAGLADLAERENLWLHVDAAFGGAALAAPSVRLKFNGIERTDSMVVDPHKWLFSPFDCAALLYRNPEIARRAHTQHAAYLDTITSRDEWNPSDYAFHLSRRARGLPFWFSLAVHGTDAYRDAVETTLATARAAADVIRSRDDVELVMEPELSVVMFRHRGWSVTDYDRWSAQLLADGVALVVPSRWRGEPVTRFCIVNPQTTIDDLTLVLDTMG